MELLARYVERTDREIVALVRAESDEEAQRRLDSVLQRVGVRPDASRVSAVAADVERDGLGLDDARRRRLAANASQIVHSAASVSFSLPLDESRQINVEGTRHMLEFAEEAARLGGLIASPTSRPPTWPATTLASSGRTTSTSANRSEMPTSSRSTRLRASCASTPGRCRFRSSVRASSSASAVAAGRRRSTSSTRR